MAGGLLAGGALNPPKGSRREQLGSFTQRYAETLTAFAGFCRELGEQEAETALAWILAQPALTAAIIGPRTLDQLNASLRALELKLDDDALAKLNDIFPGPGRPAPEAYAW